MADASAFGGRTAPRPPCSANTTKVLTYSLAIVALYLIYLMCRQLLTLSPNKSNEPGKKLRARQRKWAFLVAEAKQWCALPFTCTPLFAQQSTRLIGCACKSDAVTVTIDD